MITKSLQFQLSVIIVLIASVTLAGFGYYSYQMEKQTMQNQFKETLTKTTGRLAISLDTPLYSFHDQGIRDVILSEMNNPDIVGIYVIDTLTGGQRYWYSRDSEGTPQISDEFPDNESHMISNTPIFHESEEIGKVIVYMSTSRMDAQLQQELYTTALQILILDIVLIIIVIFVLHVKVISPLSKIESVSREIAKGNLQQNTEIRGNDEIAQLNNAINVMACNLIESQRKIEEYSENLESQVAQRTGELLKVTSKLEIEVNEHKEAEEKLRELMGDFERSNTELEQFAYVASHDLQEPLRMVSSYVSLLEKRYKDKLDKDAEEFISYAVDGASRMQQLINGLLRYSRVGTKGKPFESTDMEDVIKHAEDNLKIAIEESHAVITHDPLPTVMADDLQLSQLMQNLIGNGIKFSSDTQPHINVSAETKDNEWLFSIRDNGIGIDSKFRERIFQIFQRLHSRSEYQGTGIGLAVCKKIVERHNGQIWVESEPGKGSTFYFSIPNTGGDIK